MSWGEEQQKEIETIKERKITVKEPNMDEEIELIKKWVKEREDFINE